MMPIRPATLVFITLLLGSAATPAFAEKHHDIALEACASAISEELGIAEEAYVQRLRRVRGNRSLVKLSLKVVDATTDDEFAAKCNVRIAGPDVVSLDIEGRSEAANARAVAALN